MAMTVTVEKLDEGIKVTFPNGTSCIVKEVEDAEREAVEFLREEAPKLGFIDWQLPV